MNLQELLDTCAGSSRDDWHTIQCGGDGPSYADHFVQVGDAPHHQEHYARAVYRPDVAITMAWGLRPGNTVAINARPEYRAPWMDAFPLAAPAWFVLADVFYCGAFVYRQTLCEPEPHAALLPLPHREGETWVVSRFSRDLARLVDGLERDDTSEFDRYFQLAGFTIAD